MSNYSKCIVIALIFTSNFCFAENLKVLEDSMAFYQEKIAQAIDYDNREKANKQFLRLIKVAFLDEELFEYPFDKLEKVSTLTSPDGAFRIFNWNIPRDYHQNDYYCFIVFPVKKGPPDVVELSDSSMLSQDNENISILPSEWYGALYYQIIPGNSKRNKIYTLLGWDGNDAITSKKVIETLSINKDEIKFGEPLIKESENALPKKRKVYEYSSEVSMLLEYRPEEDIILLDHLMPVNGSLEGNFQFYGPGLSYDAFERKDGLWVLSENFNFNRPKSEEPANFNVPGGADKKTTRSEINPLTGKPR